MRQAPLIQRAVSTSRLLIVVMLLGGLLAVACGDAENPDATPTSGGGQTVATATPTMTAPAADPTPTETGEIIGEFERTGPPALSNTEADAFVEGINAFAFDFYRFVTEQHDGNLIYSPASIELAFSMVYAGARGETETQLADVLGLLPQDDQHLAANGLDGHLGKLDVGVRVPEEGEPFELSIANAVWGQRDYPFEADFLQTLAQHYGAGMNIVDFEREAEAARQLINEWIADRTQGQIEDMIPEGALDGMTRLVLVNAIYFKAGWLFPFDASATADSAFTLLDGAEVTAPMMHHRAARVPYAQHDGYQAIALPYTGETVEMVVVVPDAGQFEAIESQLSPEFLAAARAGADTYDVNLRMPKFDFKSDLDLTAILPEMGMPVPFDSALADVSGISDTGLFIDTALHSATIAVDEQGTEATAATVIAIAESAMPTAEVMLDRPFVFAITDARTGAILFMGRVMNPVG